MANELHSSQDLLNWIKQKLISTKVELHKISLEDCAPWYYDEKLGEIRNPKGSFFQITGIRQENPNGKIVEQPIIVQNEIGFLGIICCKINNTWHYLMQAKIEPGNVNVVQLSPTIQATKSNFTQQHGGSKPKYLEYFLNMSPKNVLVDQIQSEQSSRFLGKRNRNVILMVKEQLEESSSHKWMTLSQIKEFMHYDNLVNMDTRTVLSCIPYVLLEDEESDIPFEDKELFKKSAKSLNRNTIVSIYSKINNYKMFFMPVVTKVPLFSLKDWKMNGLCYKNVSNNYPFELIFCNVTIEGREVTNWNQPLFSATGNAVFGLICCIDNGIFKFLVKIKPEIGCFDGVELGPTIQEEFNSIDEKDSISDFFFEKIQRKENVIADVLLSEEGGRFYQEQNRNVIIQINKDELQNIPDNYVWSDYGTLNILTQINNCLNIQLRNLLSLLEI